MRLPHLNFLSGIPCLLQSRLTYCTSSLTKVTERNGVREIILNDPKRRNTLSLEMLMQLKADLSRDQTNPDLRAITIGSTGPVFSSGHNLKELTSKEGRSYHQHVFEECSHINILLQQLPVPVIAKVKGLAAAAGCQFVASCDIVVACKSASFSTPGINFGLFCSTPGVSVARALPRKISLYMLLTGSPITAQEAYEHGLVSRLVETEADVDVECDRLLQVITGHSRPVLSMGKHCFYRQIHKQLPDAYRDAETVMLDNLAMADGQEGIQSFIEKRKPVWTHGDDRVHE